MIILTIKTDQEESQFVLLDDQRISAKFKYLAHHNLAETIHQKIYELLESQNLNWQDIEGLVCFKGPGSFTGLRIGLSVANSLAYGFNIPIVSEEGYDWQKKGIERLLSGQNEKIAVPFYGAEPHLSKPRK